MEDKDTPLPFHYLDTLETNSKKFLSDIRKHCLRSTGANIMELQPGPHILCVYGDNFLQMVREAT